MEKVDSAIKMAKRAVALKYEDLTELEAKRAKQSIMDTIGVMLAGSTLGFKCLDVVDMMIEQGGKEEAHILGYEGKYPMETAATANGGIAHTLDYDDAVDASVVHSAASCLPAALACCEAKGASGKELIESFVAGVDMVVRLGFSCTTCLAGMGWLGPQLKAAWGAAVSAGKALGLNDDEMVNCLGIMLQQTSGTAQVLKEGGNDLRELYQCFAQKHGVFSAQLAKRGIRGPKNIFEGENALFNQYFEGKGPIDYSVLDVNEDSKWWCDEPTFKLWSCCRVTHGFIGGALDMMKEHGFTGKDIKKVVIGVGLQGPNLCQPRETRYTPQIAVDGRYSIPFSLANALVHGWVTLANFTDEGLHDPEVLAMCEKIEWYQDEELVRETKGVDFSKITIELNDGRSFYQKVTDPLGSPTNPVTDDDIVAKFRDCCSHARKPISEENVNKLVDMCLHLEEVEDIRDLIALCC